MTNAEIDVCSLVESEHATPAIRQARAALDKAYADYEQAVERDHGIRTADEAVRTAERALATLCRERLRQVHA